MIGGPPCQGFSVAGKMDRPTRAAGTCRFLDFVEHVQPEAFVMENVKALAVSDDGGQYCARPSSRARRVLGYETSLLCLRG